MISDVIVSPYHLQFDEVSEKAGNFIESVYIFQFEDFNTSWVFNYNPSYDRYTMGRGSGMISQEKTSSILSLSTPHISIFDTYSHLIWELVVDHRCSSSISQCFSDDSIAVLTDDGFYYYYVNHELKKSFSLRLKKKLYVMDACFWEDGFVVLLTNGDLFSYNSSTKPVLLKCFEDISKPKNFVIVPPNKSITGKLIVYLLVHRGEEPNIESVLYVISENYFYAVRLNELITHIAVSANYRKIAILTRDLYIRVCSIDLQNEEFKKEVESNGHLEVVNVCWVGDIAPVVCFQGAFTLVTLDSDGMPMWALDNKDNYTIGFTDVDSCIILSSEMTYRIRYVPRQVYYIFSKSFHRPTIPPVYGDEGSDDNDIDNSQEGSTDFKWNTTKKICEAFLSRLDEPPLNKLGSIGSTDILIKAAKNCLAAAEYFFDINVQDFFLNVACFTLTYINGQTSMMHDSLIRIKILNLVRKFANFNITIAQIYDIGIDHLIGRLMSRNMNFISIDIAKILRMPTIEIQKDSINKAIVNNQNDEACFNLVYEIIQNEINNDNKSGKSQADSTDNDQFNHSVNTMNLNQHLVSDFSYAAMCAIKHGRKKLATYFCNFEPNFAVKAKIFAKLGDWDQALRHAEASCDSSSLFKVIKHMMKIIMEPDYSLINKTLAKYEYAVMFIARNRDFVGKDRAETILDLVDLRAPFCDAKMRYSINFESNVNENNNNKDDNDDSESDGQKAKKKNPRNSVLKKCQKELANKNNDYSFIDLSFNDTIRKIFMMPVTDSSLKDAFELAEKCNVPSINVVTIGIRTYAISNKWNDLKKFALNKNFKSLWPLVMEMAIAQNNDQFAAEFANEVKTVFNDGNLLEQYKNGQFKISDLSDMPSYQKYFFRKQPAIMSFFKI
ncbi:hypothetical protein M9Y10_041674 [Tritrichomonas musculus]|uniref:Uncharacterized protein n=1 Tax=Tritrichomonas musculus TaxID=1915356 RepID=A0ABR2K513_9EUKA